MLLKNGSTTTQTRLTRNLAGELVAKKLDYFSRKSYVMVAKSNRIVEMDEDLAGALTW
jgi:hypothetical protein